MKAVITVCTALVLSAVIAPASARVPGGESWAEHRNERFGFTFRYPAHLFEPERASEAGDGEVFVARGGEARLLVGGLANGALQSPADYQEFIARESYSNYQITYRRVTSNWFVLSGRGQGKTFYEKVIFSCRGRLINSFAIIYPTEQQDLYGPVVEGIEATFRPGPRCEDQVRSGELRQPDDRSRLQHPRSALADRIAGQRGHDVMVILRRTSPPFDRKVVYGYVSR
jgi:hypothetical protein